MAKQSLSEAQAANINACVAEFFNTHAAEKAVLVANDGTMFFDNPAGKNSGINYAKSIDSILLVVKKGEEVKPFKDSEEEAAEAAAKEAAAKAEAEAADKAAKEEAEKAEAAQAEEPAAEEAEKAEAEPAAEEPTAEAEKAEEPAAEATEKAAAEKPAKKGNGKK